MFQWDQLDYLRNRIRLEDGLAVNASTQQARETHASLALEFRSKLRLALSRKTTA